VSLFVKYGNKITINLVTQNVKKDIVSVKSVFYSDEECCSFGGTRGLVLFKTGPFKGTGKKEINTVSTSFPTLKNNLSNVSLNSFRAYFQVYSLAGRPMERIGEKGSRDGLFWNPFGICFNKQGQLLVADCGNNRWGGSIISKGYRF